MKNRIKKPSIERLSRKAGVKSIAIDCYPLIRRVMLAKLHEVAKVILIANSENNTKTIMGNDVVTGLAILGHNVGESTYLGIHTHSK